MVNIDAPCKNCKDRYVGCHSNCIRYIDYQQLALAKREEAFEQKSINATLYTLQKHRIGERKRKRGHVR